MDILEVKNLVKSYGHGESAETVLDGLDISVADGEFVTIVGPSGCGKTTMLRCMSGLLPFDSGGVQVSGEQVTRPPETLGVVFQDYSRSLLPWLTVARNVDLPLRYLGLSRAERAVRTDEALQSVGLDRHRGKRPWQLSGGMQQRVAIARALAYRPKLLLMDEPFASVDAQTRSELEDLTLALWAEHGMTIAFITHDIDEAVYLGDRVVVLSSTPTRVKREIPVPLPRPRNQLTTKELPEFAELRSEVLRVLFKGDPAPTVVPNFPAS
ncbi:ABC transporter ATP-binding protein [Pseudonocardia nematodicida]|uniref:ABC transporter ATP-binding protein n=1 Tax=Pseudonocardia nematodicida TaxID=1206997 RepID=A0ABV1KDZ7_9PSEU